MLLGRRNERAVLDALFDAVRAGRSGALVVRGEAGVGKTALLEYAIESASGLRVVRAVGVDSEIELAFGALHQLCAPMLDRLERLPGPQRDALAVTFGLSSGAAPDRCGPSARRAGVPRAERARRAQSTSASPSTNSYTSAARLRELSVWARPSRSSTMRTARTPRSRSRSARMRPVSIRHERPAPRRRPRRVPGRVRAA